MISTWWEKSDQSINNEGWQQTASAVRTSSVKLLLLWCKSSFFFFPRVKQTQIEWCSHVAEKSWRREQCWQGTSKEALRSLLRSPRTRLSTLSCVSVSLSDSLITFLFLCDAAVTVLYCCHLTATKGGVPSRIRADSPPQNKSSQNHSEIDLKRGAA